jgi:hypothetical protein
MGKVYVYRAAAKDTFPVARPLIVTTWNPGQIFCLNTTGEFAQLASGNNAIGVGQCDDLEVSAPPTGSVVTILYGDGTKIFIDHSLEVAAGSASRAYSTDAALTASIYGLAGSTLPTLHRNPESGSINQNLYCNGIGQFALLPSQLFSSSLPNQGWSIPTQSASSSAQFVLGKMIQVPNSDNNYTLGVILRN